MNIKAGLLQAASKIAFFGNGQLWADAKEFCHLAFNDDHLSNAQRKEKVKENLKEIFQDASSLLLNFAIEFAVIFLVAKYPQLGAVINERK